MSLCGIIDDVSPFTAEVSVVLNPPSGDFPCFVLPMPKTSANPHFRIKIYQDSRFTRLSDAEILSEIPILHVEDAR